MAHDPVLPTRRTREEWYQIILDDLGGEGVDPDLSENNLRASVSRTLDMWNKYRPFKAWYPFEIPSTTSTSFYIDFFADEARVDDRRYPIGYVRNVLDVQFVDIDRSRVGTCLHHRDSYHLRWGYQGPRLFFEFYVGERNYERLTGTRPDWRWDPDTRRLWMDVTARNVGAMVLTSRDRKLEEITYDRRSDFRKALVASAKIILARVLGSRGDIPAAGGPITTDAADLRSEGREEWREVEEMLQTALSSVPPAGYIG